MKSRSIYYCVVFLALVIYMPNTISFIGFFKRAPAREISHHISEVYRGPTATYVKTFPQLAQSKIGAITKYLTTSEDAMAAFINAGREIVEQETIADQEGQLTFLHGESASSYPHQYWYRTLFEATRNITVDNYVFTRFPDTKDWSLDGIEQNALTREKIMENGCCDEYRNNSESSSSALYMSPTLFTSSGLNSCLFFFATNARFKNHHDLLENTFHQFSLGPLYKKYNQQISNLAINYDNVCPLGQMLLLKFTATAAEKTIFPALAWGEKITPYAHKNCWKTITDLHALIKNNPASINYATKYHHDHLQFCFVPTTDYGLNPDIAGKEIQIHTITGADPEKMAEYLVKEKDLTDQIRNEIQKL